MPKSSVQLKGYGVMDVSMRVRELKFKVVNPFCRVLRCKLIQDLILDWNSYASFQLQAVGIEGVLWHFSKLSCRDIQVLRRRVVSREPRTINLKNLFYLSLRNWQSPAGFDRLHAHFFCLLLPVLSRVWPDVSWSWLQLRMRSSYIIFYCLFWFLRRKSLSVFCLHCGRHIL